MRLTPPAEAVIVTDAELGTVLVVTGNVALVAPAPTVTLAGTAATAPLLLDKVTTVPPPGAGPLNVAVPVDGDPPTTVAGLSVSDESESGGASTVIVAVRVAPNVPVIV